ncbi:extracellular solute-binding protein [uncultured Georgenia sp.]|uniref:sugar ABC transporter substrate-binding protein n=1 Tax=uncultured Georgenia sp. TaxID=378209 RepID=UPI0026204DDD|nr:extracellular solute-binding protein [uncultured Georgenia sp.]HLV05838.1 extracellular solute-binding protein [Actinomycetaceae bacterium]
MASSTRQYRRMSTLLAGASALVLTLAACGSGSGFDDDGTTDDPATGGADAGEASLEILIASSGDAETRAVKDAVAAWSESSGVEATVNVASDLPQQLSQGFAAGSPPDLFYVSTDHFVGYAANGSLLPYGDQLDNVDDFYPTLRESFTYEDELYCAPKDFSTLALFINNEAWAAAGLTEEDVPATWEELSDVAATLAETNEAGLTFGPEWQRVGAFMAQAGGSLVSEDGTSATVDSPENLEALTYVQELLDSGAVRYPADIGAGWGGEAFGTGAAAMTIEGNWLVGALANDFPDIDYRVVPLPEGPAGPGTLQFTNCWGVATDSANQDDAIELVQFLTSPQQQMEFARAFGVMPSIESAADQWTSEFPEQAAFLESVEFAQGVPAVQGISDVISDFNSQLEGLAGGDPQGLLSSVQSTLDATLAQ